jgi:CRP-like cAMP-binding protein
MAIEIEFLKSIPYFEGLSPVELESISRSIFERKIERGEIVLYEGEPARALYFVVSGAVKVFKTSTEGKEQILSIVRPGESFNDVPVFDDGPNPASAQAMGQVILYELSKSELKTLIQNYPQIATNTIRVLAKQVRGLVSLVEDLSFRHVIGRVAKILLEHAGDGTKPAQRLTQQEMAAMAGSAREVIGRSLKTLEEEGIIRLERHRIIITNKEALKEMVESPL